MTDASPHAQVAQTLMGQVTSSTVAALARLGIPDQLESGPKTVDELAQAVNAQPDLLFRLMRATASIGFLAQTPEGKWAQTPKSDVLRTNASRTLRHWAVMSADEWCTRNYGSLDETVRTGQPAFDRIYGMSGFEFFDRNPAAGENFNRTMTAFSAAEAPAVADAYDFSGIGSLTDVGGGHGLLLTTILERNPGMTGTLYELPQVIRGVAEGQIERVKDRIRLSEGNMFESIPPGSDAYIMKRVIHDWPDELCKKILSGCRAGIQDGGRLLVVDSVVPTDRRFSPAKFMDLTLMLFSGGKERTEDEFRALFAASGWKLNRIVPTAEQLSIVEGLPA